jgi:Undecaprenyl-phosphate glucose phosphotransferase
MEASLMPPDDSALLHKPAGHDASSQRPAPGGTAAAIATEFSYRSGRPGEAVWPDRGWAFYGSRDTEGCGIRDNFASPGTLRRLSLLLTFADGGVAMLAFIAVLALPHASGALRPGLEMTAALSALLMVWGLRGSGAYADLTKDGLSKQLGRAFLNCTAVFALLLGLEQYARDPHLSYGSIGVWYSGTLLGLVCLRVAAYLTLRRWRRSGRLARVVAVVDVGGPGRALAHRMRQKSPADIYFIGLFAANGDGHNGIDALMRVARVIRVDEIIVAAPETAGAEIDATICRLSAMPINVHICTRPIDTDFPKFESSLLFGHPVWTVHRRPLDGWGGVVKRAEDIAIGGLLLLLLSPLMAAIAIAVKLDSPGPVLFRQKRLGLGNGVFEILKFRTMTHQTVPETDVQQAQRNDPRVTRIGRFLRRSSLDELPQLLNVLKGDMSLVGPRPHALSHNEQYSAVIEGYWGRHRMRPGITGWAQVHGCRGRTETLEKMQRRVAYDLDYIEGWSLLLDLRVLLMTVFVCAVGWESY